MIPQPKTTCANVRIGERLHEESDRCGCASVFVLRKLGYEKSLEVSSTNNKAKAGLEKLQEMK